MGRVESGLSPGVPSGRQRPANAAFDYDGQRTRIAGRLPARHDHYRHRRTAGVAEGVSSFVANSHFPPHIFRQLLRVVSGLAKNVGRKMRTSAPLPRRIDVVAEPRFAAALPYGITWPVFGSTVMFSFSSSTT